MKVTSKKTKIHPISPEIYFSPEFQALSFEEKFEVIGTQIKRFLTPLQYKKMIKRYKRIKSIKEMYFGGKTYVEIGKIFKISHQRVSQVILGLNLSKRVKEKKLYKNKCKKCNKEFSEIFKKVFCSNECRVANKRTKEEQMEIYRKYANKYYYDVMKKKSNFKKIIKERNDRHFKSDSYLKWKLEKRNNKIVNHYLNKYRKIKSIAGQFFISEKEVKKVLKLKGLL